MKINTTFHVLVLFMAVLTFSMPFATLAQKNSVEAQAIIDAATEDANKDVSKPLWFGAGFLLSGLLFLPIPYGYILPPASAIGTYFYRPAPPPSRLIGKSPEYIAAYTSAYKLKRGNVQVRWTSAGCLSGCIVAVVVGIGVRIGVASTTQ